MIIYSLSSLIAFTLVLNVVLWLSRLGLVPLNVSLPWAFGFLGIFSFIVIVLAKDLIPRVRDSLIRRKLRMVEAKYPNARATELSRRRTLLTDRRTGATIGVLDRRGAVK